MAAKELSEATEGDVFRHADTGAVVVVVSHDGPRLADLLTVQLNEAEGHTPGWVSVLFGDAAGWAYVRTAL